MPKFIKTKEDFTCERCGHKVKGSGYTNHCPKCLWSKHVDINPGDRAAACGGLMKPVDLYFGKQKWIIEHQCQSCGYKSKDKIRENDDFDEAVRLEKEINEKKTKKK